MKKDINDIMMDLKKVANQEYYAEDLFSYEECQILYDFIVDLQEKYRESCETYQKALDETMSEKMDLEKENRMLKELNICVGCNNNSVYKSRNEKSKNKYLIVLNGCDDSTECEIELRKEQIETFMQIAKEINKKSTYQCEPNISIYEKYKKDEYFYYEDKEYIDLLETKGE